MQRLTKRIGGYAHGAEGVSKDKLTGTYCRGKFEATACVERLASYEDTGLTPEKIIEIDKLYAEKCKEVAKYNKLNEQGLLLKPKCKPGDIVWEANQERNIISEYEVASIRYGINKTFHYMWTLRCGIYSDLDGFWDKDFGKTVFLTQAEAEEALKRMKGENETD